jgi:hypothetical protein
VERWRRLGLLRRLSSPIYSSRQGQYRQFLVGDGGDVVASTERFQTRISSLLDILDRVADVKGHWDGRWHPQWSRTSAMTRLRWRALSRTGKMTTQIFIYLIEGVRGLG